MKFYKTFSLLLLFSTLGFAADAHVTSRTVKYVATASPVKYVKDGAKVSAKAVKATFKVATFPVVHPVKSAHGVYKAGKQVF